MLGFTLFLLVQASGAQEEKLYTAVPHTKNGEFTAGIEGPACDKEGYLFAVNFEKQRTIGRVTPAGAGEVFVVLPEKAPATEFASTAKG